MSHIYTCATVINKDFFIPLNQMNELHIFFKIHMRQIRKIIYPSFFVLNIFILLSSLHVYSQPAKFIKYSTQMGLSSNSQRCVIQDHDGFIWIGTGDGVNRFDGRTFKVYRKIPNDSTSLRSNNVMCMYVDRKGVLWIGTFQSGLSRYNKEKDIFFKEFLPGYSLALKFNSFKFFLYLKKI